jgi:nucleotide-binding universal stress UspA family protein
MPSDLRDVVNKIIVAVGEDEATAEEIAGLASDLAAFFDAAVVLVYVGGMPARMPASEGRPVDPSIGLAMDAIEQSGRRVLDRMAEVLVANGVQVSSRLIMGSGEHALQGVIEEERCDLVVLPHWQTGVTQRLLRVFSPSILEEATCPVLVLKGNRWLSKSKAPRPGKSSG